MKKFDIEKAKNGAAVCLRDGTPVKILDFDYNGKILYKFLTVEKDKDGKENMEYELGWADVNGIGFGRYANQTDRCRDLIMAPVYGYMNVFKNEDNKVFVGGVIRASELDCIDTGKEDLIPGTKWFCTARVELLIDEGGAQ